MLDLLRGSSLQWAKKASVDGSKVTAPAMCAEIARLIKAAQGKVDYVKESSLHISFSCICFDAAGSSQQSSLVCIIPVLAHARL